MEAQTRVKASYSVCVLGFNATEQLVLGSIFGLSARRDPRFVRHPDGAGDPDLFLVDADDIAAVTGLVSRNGDRRIPAVLVGASDHGTGWPRLSRPLQWARLFVAFDVSIRSRRPLPGPADSRLRGMPPDSLPAPSAEAALDPEATQVIPGRARALAELRARAAAPADETPAAPGLEAAPGPGPLQTGIDGEEDTERAGGWVMVVDGDASAREALCTRLRALRLNVAGAASGEEAIGLTARRHFACVFADTGAPGLDGYQVCRVIKTRRGARPAAVILMTAKGSTVERIRAKMAGCDAQLAKPFEDNRLLELVVRFLPAALTA